jgi:CubicO group peptidase (beta-lactamase class C family)
MAAALITSSSIRTAATGVRKAGVATAVQLMDRFHLGSDTKAMTVTLAGILVEEGMLSWNSRVTDVFPELTGTLSPAYANITLDQLLSNRSGVPAFENLTDFALVPEFGDTPTQQRRAFTEWLLIREPAVPPGTYLYSNVGYTVAAAMMEKVTGKTWENLMSQKLFSPLGIDGRLGWPAANDPNQPWGHIETGGRILPHNPNTPGEQVPLLAAPAGDVNMTVGDFAAWAQFHLRGLRGQDGLLKSATIKYLHTAKSGGEYAMGWEVLPINGYTSSVHEGSADTFHAFIIIQPSRDLAAVVVTNLGGQTARLAIAEAAAEMLR